MAYRTLVIFRTQGRGKQHIAFLPEIPGSTAKECLALILGHRSPCFLPGADVVKGQDMGTREKDALTHQLTNVLTFENVEALDTISRGMLTEWAALRQSYLDATP